MSRLVEVMENHENLDDLLSIMKHYAVSAEFVSFSLIEQFKKKQEDEDNEENSENKEDQQHTSELLEDLNQFQARL